MPVVLPTSNTRVLVTGANGYIAMWVVRMLLEEGYCVRGTVRSAGKAAGLGQYFKSYGSKFEVVVVEDITKDGAFEDAVKDVDAIQHIASPSPDAGPDPDDLIKPAVNGTLSLFTSALNSGANIKRIVLTSSCSAIESQVTKPTVFDETDWADEVARAVLHGGGNTNRMENYGASKTLAEKAAWDFYNLHKHEIKWDLVALNPSLVIGPALQDWKVLREMAASLAYWYHVALTEKPDVVLKTSYNHIDIRDVAAAHILALQKEKAGGERIIASEGSLTWQETRNLLYSLIPEDYEAGILPRGIPDIDQMILCEFDTTKSKRILGLQYRSAAQTFSDTLADFRVRGWLKKPEEPDS